MLSVTQAYKDVIKSRAFEWRARLTFTSGEETLVLYNENLLLGSLKVEEQALSTDEFTVGGVASSTAEVSILKSDLSTFEVEGSNLFIEYGLKVGGSFVYLPMGHFIVDEADVGETYVLIKAFDYLILTDNKYETNLEFPATVRQIYNEIFTKTGLNCVYTPFLNEDIIVEQSPKLKTYRTVLSYLMEISGNFGKMNRLGVFEPRWFSNIDYTIDSENRFSLIVRKDTVKITGIIHKDYLYNSVGTDVYPINIGDNPLIDKDYADVLNSILTKVEEVSFNPSSGEIPLTPFLEVGDIITNIHRDEVSYITPLTKLTHYFGSKTAFEAQARPELAQASPGFRDEIIGTINDYIASQIRVFENLITSTVTELKTDLEGQISTVEQTSENLTISFGDFKTLVDQDITSLKDLETKINAKFTFSDAGLLISSENPLNPEEVISLSLAPDILVFMQSGTQLGYFSGNNFLVKNMVVEENIETKTAEIKERLLLGGFLIEAYTNGVTMNWVGE